jgi:hypothetical protein
MPTLWSDLSDPDAVSRSLGLLYPGSSSGPTLHWGARGALEGANKLLCWAFFVVGDGSTCRGGITSDGKDKYGNPEALVGGAAADSAAQAFSCKHPASDDFIALLLLQLVSTAVNMLMLVIVGSSTLRPS